MATGYNSLDTLIESYRTDNQTKNINSEYQSLKALSEQFDNIKKKHQQIETLQTQCDKINSQKKSPSMTHPSKMRFLPRCDNAIDDITDKHDSQTPLYKTIYIILGILATIVIAMIDINVLFPTSLGITQNIWIVPFINNSKTLAKTTYFIALCLWMVIFSIFICPSISSKYDTSSTPYKFWDVAFWISLVGSIVVLVISFIVHFNAHGGFDNILSFILCLVTYVIVLVLYVILGLVDWIVSGAIILLFHLPIIGVLSLAIISPKITDSIREWQLDKKIYKFEDSRKRRHLYLQDVAEEPARLEEYTQKYNAHITEIETYNTLCEAKIAKHNEEIYSLRREIQKTNADISKCTVLTPSQLNESKVKQILKYMETEGARTISEANYMIRQDKHNAEMKAELNRKMQALEEQQARESERYKAIIEQNNAALLAENQRHNREMEEEAKRGNEILKKSAEEAHREAEKARELAESDSIYAVRAADRTNQTLNYIYDELRKL